MRLHHQLEKQGAGDDPREDKFFFNFPGYKRVGADGEIIFILS